MKLFEELRMVWRYLSKYKARVLKIAILAIVGSIVAAAIPYLYGRLIDVARAGDSNIGVILAILGIWFLASFASDWISRFASTRGSFIGIDASNDLIYETANHVLTLPLSFHRDKKMGEIVSRIQRAGDYLERIINDIIFNTAPQFLTIFIALIFLFYIEWRLALGLIAVVIAYSAATILKTIPIIKNQERLNKINEEVNGDLYDSILNIQIVKSSAAENFEKEKIEKNYKEKLGKAEKNNQFLWQSLEMWQKTIFSSGFVALFGFAILFLRSGNLSVGELVMLLGYISMATRPFGWLGNQYRIFRQGITAIERVRTIFSEKPEKYHTVQSRILRNPIGKIEFRNVGFGYTENQTVLDGISFVARPGETVALVGGSGVGKTTLVDLIPRYYIPTKGLILVDDVDIANIDLISLRNLMAIVPQEISLFNDTVKNNIRYAKPEATDEEIVEAAKGAYAHEFIEELPEKYDTLVGERGIKLSGGQKQRIAIARAILRNPKILILDEATSSLDSQSEKLVQEALEKLIRGRTTFVIAHRLSTVREADKILVLEGGRIVEEGKHQELIDRKGVYSKLYCLQFDLDAS